MLLLATNRAKGDISFPNCKPYDQFQWDVHARSSVLTMLTWCLRSKNEPTFGVKAYTHGHDSKKGRQIISKDAEK
jgi:hypothetical protein